MSILPLTEDTSCQFTVKSGNVLSNCRPAAFLDRDGVLIVDEGYPHDPTRIRWVEGAHSAVRRLNEMGYFVFVVTNQAGVARGYYSEKAVHRLHCWMAAHMAANGAHIDSWEYCPHHPQAISTTFRRSCRRRKPKPGMLIDLMKEWPVVREGSFMIGDRITDMEAAAAAGVPGYLFSTRNLDQFIVSLIAEGRISNTTVPFNA